MTQKIKPEYQFIEIVHMFFYHYFMVLHLTEMPIFLSFNHQFLIIIQD